MYETMWVSRGDAAAGLGVRITLLAVLLAARDVRAQAPDISATTGATARLAQAAPLRLRLDEAIAMATARHPALAVAAAQAKASAALATEARSARVNRLVPEVELSLAYTRQLQNQFDAIARRLTGDAPLPAAGDPLTEVFTARNAASAALRATIRPLDIAGSSRAESARFAAEQSALGRVTARAQLELAVVEAYADVQLGRRLLDVADSALAQAERAVRHVRLVVDEGRASEFDLARTRASQAEQVPVRVRAAAAAQLAALRLAQLLGVPGDTPFDLVTRLDDAPAAGAALRLAASATVQSGPSPRADEPASPPAGDSRSALRQSALGLRSAEAAVRAARAARLPVLNVTGEHQRFAYPGTASLGITPLFPNSTVSVTLSLPIDLTGRTSGQVAGAVARLEELRAQDQLAREQATLEESASALAVQQAEAEWQAADAGVSSASRGFAIAEVRFAAGRSNRLELDDARLALARAASARARAARDWHVARARLERLADLPLGGAAAPSTAVPVTGASLTETP